MSPRQHRVYNRINYPERGPGALVLNEVPLPQERRTVLELYASLQGKAPVTIESTDEAYALAHCLMHWAAQQHQHRGIRTMLKFLLGGKP